MNKNILNTKAEINANNSNSDNNKNNTNTSHKIVKNSEKEIMINDKKELELSINNNGIFETENQAKNNINNVKTGDFLQLGNENNFNNNNDNHAGKKFNDSSINNNEKDEESMNKIKNQIRSNLTFLNLLHQNNQEKKSEETLEDEEEVFNNNQNHRYNNNEIISEKCEHEGIEIKFTEEEKFAKILMNQEGKMNEESVDEIDKEIKNLEAKKKKILERKNTDNIASSFNLRNKVLPNLHISNMILKEKTGINKHVKIDKMNLLRSNTNKFVNYSSNSNSKQDSVSGGDEVFSLKSFKFARQKTKSGKHLRLDKLGFYKQNSQFSCKSSSSNKNSAFTFNNHPHMRDRESLDIGNSLLEVF